jgi:hypothetical protein
MLFNAKDAKVREGKIKNKKLSEVIRHEYGGMGFKAGGTHVIGGRKVEKKTTRNPAHSLFVPPLFPCVPLRTPQGGIEMNPLR